ncbi:MAG TPA: AAA family ATPase [Usitatibacter sp.]|jgi:predicted ATPase|nr:AAA family ATPase [Usitatibacter sp.]
MSRAKLSSITLAAFKSHAKPSRIPLAPLTVVVGRNNSGKSSVIQALLLLKQTLQSPRSDIPLHIEGYVDALSLRELTYGWPSPSDYVEGPTFSVQWESIVDIDGALERALRPDLDTLINTANLRSIESQIRGGGSMRVVTELKLEFAEVQGRTVLERATVESSTAPDALIVTASYLVERNSDGLYQCRWNDDLADRITVELEHFLPYLEIDRRNLGPRHGHRSLHNAFVLLFAEPLDDLKSLLTRFSYLGPMRDLPPTLYRPANAPSDDLGVSGQYAAQILRAHRSDFVHYFAPVELDSSGNWTPSLRSKSLVAAVNDVFSSLGIESDLKIDDVMDVGFRLLFGKATLQHVGRGLSYLLPVVQLGLMADPFRFEQLPQAASSQDYIRMAGFWPCAFEEPEAHLHPKVQSRLAHWLVALGMANRQQIVETHSDHLVRRLRGLAAGSMEGSFVEQWLTTNVQIVQTEQINGVTRVSCSRLTKDGGIESWPSDFMDESSNQEQAIYYASLRKSEPGSPPESFEAKIVHADSGSQSK